MIPKKNFCGMHFLGMKVIDDGRTSAVLDGNLADRLNVAGDAQREGKFSLADTILRDVIAEYALDELPFEVLCPLSIRAVQVLEGTTSNRNGTKIPIKTLADLVQHKLSDLRGWYNFGAVSKAILGERLRSLGLNLSGQKDHQWVMSLSDTRLGQKQRLDRLLLLPMFLSLKIWTNGIDTVIAKDLNDVRELIAVHTRLMTGSDEFDEDAKWQVCDNDERLEISDADDGGTTSDADDGGTTTKTCAEWIASEGRGFLCSTE